MRLIRVFPRRTKATPDDTLAVCREPELFDQADAVHVSVSFSWDIPAADRLANLWGQVAPVTVGGPAIGMRSEEFTPGKYIKNGYVITSRGCPNKCWFCAVPKREGSVRELPIVDGWNVLDDNLLACSEQHIRSVFGMLKRQKHRAEFTGGLEAARLKNWHCELLADLNPKQMFFAYDTPEDLEPLRQAGKLLHEYGFTLRGRKCRCYVLCGYPRDTQQAAEKRMHEALSAGFIPMAMLWRDKHGSPDDAWRKFQRLWARPAIVMTRFVTPDRGKEMKR